MHISKSENSKLNYFIPLLLGITTFFLIIGPKALNPLNIQWLLRGDALEDYLGWAFFKNSSWMFPPGLNPKYGLEISSSIVFSDSIPLLSFFFKTFNFLLPDKFQFFGIWILCCFILQAFAAWQLTRLTTTNLVALVISTLLFIFSPAMLWRIDELQTALAGHFLILFGIYMNLRPSENMRILWWSILICTSISVHFYIFSMVFLLWAASLGDTWIFQKKINLKQAMIEFIVISCALICIAWVAGYFAISGDSASEWGYGQFNFNILSIFYSRGWSHFNLIKGYTKDYESFNYLGAGILLLIFSCIPIGIYRLHAKLRPFIKLHYLFISCLVSMLLYAISNNIDIGRWSFEISFPESFKPFFNILRHSNRFFWPVYYSLLLLSIYFLLQFKYRKYNYLFWIFILAIQIYDTHAGWGPLRQKLMWPAPPEDGFPLQNRFWENAAKKYKNIIKIPISHKPPQWGIFARYAADYQLATNSVSFARVDKEKLAQSNSNFLEMLDTGKFNDDTLYVIDDWKLFPVDVRFNPQIDLFARIDGFNVLAPNWKMCFSCEQVPKEFEIPRLAPPIVVAKKIFFRQYDDARNQFLLRGWSWPGEDWGTWSDQENSKILLPMPENGKPKIIVLELRALVLPTHPVQAFSVSINGILVDSFVLNQPDNNRIYIPIPSSEIEKFKLEINFKFFNAISPQAAGLSNGDTRLLAIGLKSLEFK